MKYFNVHKSYEIIRDKLINWVETFIAMLPNLVLCMVLLVMFYFLSRFLRMLVVKGAKKVTYNVALTKLIGTLTFVTIMSLGFFIALSVLKLDKAVTSLLAGAGVIGLALSFAFQDSATNFISGIFMAVRKPFKIEDVIETADELGVVKHINLRNIVMHSFNGQQVIIPNKDVFQNKIKNYTSLPSRRIEINCGVEYGSNLEKVQQVGEKAIKALDFVSKKNEVNVFFNEYGGSAINFTLYFWIEVNDQPGFLKARSEAIIALKKAFDQNNIGIPFPIRTLHFNPQKIKEIVTD